jgi:DNA-binding NtrC family response regulator
MTPEKAILVVDDEMMILMSIKRSLRMKFGSSYLYEIAPSAELGLAAIERLSAEGIAVVLVISDWLMPGMKGDEFLTIVHARHPLVRLIMLSGHLDETDMEKHKKDMNLLAFLRKPWDVDQLLEIVQVALN